MAGFDGVGRRYICSATYTSGGDKRYLIREVISPKTGNDLREAVVELFVSDLLGESASKPAGPESESKEKARQQYRGYMSGKLTDLNIDELKDQGVSVRK